MHQLHFTVSKLYSPSSELSQKDKKDVIYSIKREVEAEFTETSKWDWFHVIGFINLTTNKVYIDQSDYRFQDVFTKDDVNWNTHLAQMIKDEILQLKPPKFEDNPSYFFEMEDYLKSINSLNRFNRDIVNGDIQNISINHSLLPNKVEDFSGYNDYDFDCLGVTPIDEIDICITENANEEIILGLIDVHC